MAVIKNPTKEELEKYSITIRAAVAPDNSSAIMLVEGPGTGNFLRFIEKLAVVNIKVDETGKIESDGEITDEQKAEVLAGMFS